MISVAKHGFYNRNEICKIKNLKMAVILEGTSINKRKSRMFRKRRPFYGQKFSRTWNEIWKKFSFQLFQFSEGFEVSQKLDFRR